MPESFSQLKQDIIRIYNSINQEIFGIGVRSQRVEILGDKILIFAIHKRIPALKMLDKDERSLTRVVDRSLVEANKRILTERLREIIDIPIITILKDYDPYSEHAVTVIILERSMEESQ